GGPAHRQPAPPRARRAPQRHLRLHLPVLPPAARTHDAGERAGAGPDPVLVPGLVGRAGDIAAAGRGPVGARRPGPPPAAPAARGAPGGGGGGGRSPGPWPPGRGPPSPTSRPATWTPPAGARSWGCSAT